MAGKGDRRGEAVPVDTSKTLARPRAQAARAGDIRVADERAQRRGELVLDRYRLLDRLGAGGFGTVWRAHDEQLDRAVALKRIPLPSAVERDRALREAHATARLAHPAIVALYEACATEDAFYLISELVEGDTLAALIERDALCDAEIVEIGLALSDALAHAHARGVIHRDVKPHNVLVPAEPFERPPSRGSGSPAVAKLADFGGALLAGGEALTQVGDVYGTLAYMSPEQSDGEEVSAASDLYSLALVLYEAFSGDNPVRARTPAATARRIGMEIPPLRRVRRDLPRELARGLDLALSPDPAARGELADLRAALERAPMRAVAEPHPRSRRRSDSPRAEPRGQVSPAEPSRPSRTLLDPRTAPALHPRSKSSLEPGPELDAAAEPSPRLALPRFAWIGCALATAAWQAAGGRPGVALLLLAAATPLLLLPRRSGPGWLAAAAAPALGLAGLAGAFPALAGQRAGWRARATLGALGFWWLALAEPLLARHLWLGPPSGLPPRSTWEASLGAAATHVLSGVLTPRLAIGVGVWAIAAAVLPRIVRGRNVGLDAVVAIAWTLALLAATPLLEQALLAHAGQGSPRGALLGALLGCGLAIGARALRGPVSPGIP